MAVPNEVTRPTEDNESEKQLVFVKDRVGNTLKLQLFDGIYCHNKYDPKIFRQIKSVTLRPDDIYLCAYPRTGQHWTFEQTSMLLNGNAETIKKYKGRNQIDFEYNEVLSCLPSPRVLPVHKRLSYAPRDLREKKCKIIFPLRDPKDVAVSIYNVYVDWKMYVGDDVSFENFLYLFLEEKVEEGGLFSHWRDAEKFFDENPDIPVHFEVYEEIHKDPVLAVQKLSDFLGLARDNTLCRAIADKCTFSKMVVDKKPYSRIVDGKSLLYRKGTVGDWKNWFTDEMLEDYYRVYEEKMAGSRFYERYARHKEI